MAILRLKSVFNLECTRASSSHRVKQKHSNMKEKGFFCSVTITRLKKARLLAGYISYIPQSYLLAASWLWLWIAGFSYFKTAFFFISPSSVSKEMRKGTAAYQLGNTSSRTITEVTQC